MVRRRPVRWRWVSCALALSLVTGSLAAGCLVTGSQVAGAEAAAPQLRLETSPQSPHRGSVEVVGLAPETLARLAREDLSREAWQGLLALFVGRHLKPPTTLPPVLGSYAVEGSRVRFTPRFPLVDGETYSALWLAGEEPVAATFTLPRRELSATTEVAAVYPSSDELPENQLKLYLHFTAPMSRGDVHRHIHLVNEEGREVRGAFVAPWQELWDPETTRLTLFFDPGRLKRNVGPNAEHGPVLTVGKSYRLVIDKELLDGRGVPLRRGFEKPFRAVAPDRSEPRLESWRLSPPATPDAPLAVEFPEPLDHALLQRLLAVEDSRGMTRAGTIEISSHETRWVFHPSEEWQAGDYRLRVGSALEDLAGNNLNRPFDLDLLEHDPPPDGPAVIELPFTVGPFPP